MFDDEDDDDVIIDNNQNQNQSADNNQSDDNQQQDAAPTPPAIDHDAIARTVASTMQSMQSPQPQQQFTPEEIAKHLQVWNPDEGFVNELNKLVDPEVPLDQRAKLLHQMRDGMVGQAFRGAELLVEQKVQELLQRVAPAVQYAQERESKKLMGEFEGKYPALKGQKELVDSITARLGATGFKPKSKDEAFEKVAQVAEQILKGVNPEFTLKPSGGSNGRPSMAGTNMGGQTGGFQSSQRTQSSGKRGGLASIFQNR